MAMSRTDLAEKQWRQLEPYLPPNPRRGHAYIGHRRVIDGILFRAVATRYEKRGQNFLAAVFLATIILWLL